jgi:hypothetical protein
MGLAANRAVRRWSPSKPGQPRGLSMKFAPATIFASALTVLAAGTTFADNLTEDRALYSALNVLTFVTKETSTELKITPAQEKALQASKEKRDKIWSRYTDELGKVKQSKLPESDKNAKARALETKASNDLFKAYGETLRPEQVKRMKQIVLQVRGMEIFNHAEIRDALKIGDKEVKVLRSAYDKLAQEMVVELQADVKSKKISQQDAAQKAISMKFSVPDRVRESLNQDQRKVLEDLLGEKYSYRK